MRYVISFLGVTLLGLSLAACSSAKKPAAQSPVASAAPVAPSKPLTPPQQQAVNDAIQQTGGTGVGFDDEILKLCPQVTPPRFDYDSAKVKTNFQNALVALAECMNSGGLKDKTLLLVGHADPRGEEDYNMALGGRRADSVRKALGSLGVTESRLDVSSRGALDAKGTDEASWSQDRRVDIKLKTH